MRRCVSRKKPDFSPSKALKVGMEWLMITSIYIMWFSLPISLWLTNIQPQAGATAAAPPLHSWKSLLDQKKQLMWLEMVSTGPTFRGHRYPKNCHLHFMSCSLQWYCEHSWLFLPVSTILWQQVEDRNCVKLFRCLIYLFIWTCLLDSYYAPKSQTLAWAREV
jgi:hypothetical protein